MGFGRGLEGCPPAWPLTAIQRMSFENNLLLCFPVQGRRHSPLLHGVSPMVLQ